MSRAGVIERLMQYAFDLQSEALALQEKLEVVNEKIEIVSDRLGTLIDQNEFETELDGYDKD